MSFYYYRNSRAPRKELTRYYLAEARTDSTNGLREWLTALLGLITQLHETDGVTDA